jgi:hypothetical protein
MFDRITRSALAVALVLAGAAAAFAESYLHQHVRVERLTGQQIVGEVIDEQDDTLLLKIGKAGTTNIDRSEIKSIDSIETLWNEIKKKEAAAKTGEDWWQIGLIYDKEHFHNSFMREACEHAIKVDPNHEASRKKLGYVGIKDERGQTMWKLKKEAESIKKTQGDIEKQKVSMSDRPWDGVDEKGEPYKITVMKPDKQPEYEVITNCPKEVAEDYASFMVELRKQLVTLIEATVKPQKIEWQKNPCTVCKGSGKDGTQVCPRCGGRTQEPCKLFICNSHKLFMDVTGSPEGLGGYYRPGFFPPGDCERPIVTFHGQFGTGNTFMVLAHEGTHQLEHQMWKGDNGSLFQRPGWLTEGLAVFFGDGLDISKKTAKGERIFSVDIPRDRLAGLRRQLAQGPGKYYPIKLFTSVGIPEFQQDPGLYAYGWSLIYYMLNCKDKFKFGGKEIDLREAFGKFFMANCEKGALEQYPQRAAFMGLGKAMGIENPKEAEEACDELEKLWKDYILKLPIKSVGEFDKKDKKRFVSDELKFEFSLPGGKKKSRVEWKLVAPEDLSSTLLDEAAAFTDASGQARAIVAIHANAEVLEVEDALELIRTRTKQRRYAPFEDTVEKGDDPIEVTLPGSGKRALVVNFTGKERKFPGYYDNPRANKQKGKMMVVATAAKIYQVIIVADEDAFSTYESELQEIMNSFAITGG